MGKYDKFDGIVGDGAIPTLLCIISNELAEANRLKRFELAKKHGYSKIVDGMSEWVPDEELGDQA